MYSSLHLGQRENSGSQLDGVRRRAVAGQPDIGEDTLGPALPPSPSEPQVAAPRPEATRRCCQLSILAADLGSRFPDQGEPFRVSARRSRPPPRAGGPAGNSAWRHGSRWSRSCKTRRPEPRLWALGVREVAPSARSSHSRRCSSRPSASLKAAGSGQCAGSSGQQLEPRLPKFGTGRERSTRCASHRAVATNSTNPRRA